MFSNAHGTSLKDCHLAGRDVNISNYTIAGKPVLEILYENSAPGGFHISKERYDPPKCHEDTRLTIRQDLLDQVIAAVVSCMLWLYGAAGAGKSAIAQSFAETCQKKGLLIATFFFFRTSPLRNNADRLAASLAYQLARSIPSTLQYIAHCIETHPAIFDSSLEDQLEKLFIQPLHRAFEEDSSLRDSGPRLVILDGMDECDTAQIQPSTMIVVALEKMLKDTSIPIVFLLTSRPEIHISSTFESLDHRASIETFRFGLNDHKDINKDIRLYLNDKLQEIKRAHYFKKYLPEDWPNTNDVDSIVWKSSGQFIYAATIIRYIGYPRCKPHERLELALDSWKHYASTVQDSPFKELDTLYLQIFSGVKDKVTTLAILYYSRSNCRTIASYLGLSPGDVELHISNLTSLMKYEGEETPIRVFHSSLLDFLEDEQRSGSLHIHQPVVHTCLAKAYVRHFLNPESPTNTAFFNASRHLSLAELDPELSTLVANFESRIPTFIKMFLSHYRWTDRHGWNLASGGFSDMVNTAHDLKDVIGTATNNPTFWDQCLEAIHAVFLKELQVYLTNEATHDFLVLAAFSEQTLGKNLPVSPGSLSMSEWRLCYNNVIFENIHSGGGQPFYGAIQEILQLFLLDPKQEFYVTPKHFTQLTLKCLKAIRNNGLLNEIPIRPYVDYSFFGMPMEEQHYIQAVCTTTGLLQKAPQSGELIDILETSDCQLQWLTNHPKVVEAYQKAIDSYLKTYSLKSGSSTKRRHCSEEPVDAVDNSSISTHIQKRVRRTTISDGTVKAFTSFEDKGKEREREIERGQEGLQ